MVQQSTFKPGTPASRASRYVAWVDGLPQWRGDALINGSRTIDGDGFWVKGHDFKRGPEDYRVEVNVNFKGRTPQWEWWSFTEDELRSGEGGQKA